MIGYLVIFGPAAAFLIAGFRAASRPETKWSMLLGVAAAATIGWLAYVALVPHQDGARTVFGTSPVTHDGAAFLLYPLLAFVPCAIAGWRRAAHPMAIGAAATIGPLLLADFTTPQGDGDGLWGLIFVMLPVVGLGFAGIALVASIFTAASEAEIKNTRVARRTAAFVVDAALVGIVGGMPADALASRHKEVAAVALIFAVGIVLVAGPLALWSATLGQRLFGLTVTPVSTDEPISTPQALARVAIIFVELFVSLPLVAIPLLIDFTAVETKGISAADYLSGTRVKSRIREGFLPR